MPVLQLSAIALARWRKGPSPSIILLVQFHNERARLPDFFSNVLPHVDGIIGLDDGSDDGSGEYFQVQPKVLRVVYRPVRIPHEWDEPANRRDLMSVASQYRPDWLLALDVDERLERDFRCQVQPFLRVAQWLGCSSISQPLREMWDSLSTFRCDGIWGRKRRERLFRWSEHHQVDPTAFHGTWTSVAGTARPRTLASPLPIYHLGMLTETLRQQRVQKYQALDPEHRFQAIGYAYLNCKDGLRLESINPDRDFQLVELFKAATPSSILRGQARFFKTLSGVLKWSQTTGLDTSDPETALLIRRKLDFGLRHVCGSYHRFGDAGWLSAASGTRSFMLVNGPGDIGGDCLNTLVRRLCSNRGYRQMSLDPVLQLLTSVQDERLRNAIGAQVLETLFKRFPSGVIFELSASCLKALMAWLPEPESGACRLSDLCRPVRINTRLHSRTLVSRDVRMSVYCLAGDDPHDGLQDGPAQLTRQPGEHHSGSEVLRCQARLDMDDLVRAQAVIEQFEGSPFSSGACCEGDA